MNAQKIIIPKINLFEKRYIASRVACILFFIFTTMYMIGGRPVVVYFFTLPVMVLLAFQFIFQYKTVNGILGGLFFLLSVYMSLAVVSEYSEFEEITQAAKQLLMVGLGGCLAGIILSVFMIWSFVHDF